MMEQKEKTYSGIIYCYRLNVECEQKGWPYVGESADKENRQSNWHKANNTHYGGKKITEAREKYGVDNWTYEVLESDIIASTKEELKTLLHEREAFWIKKLDAYEHGFNGNFGGTGNTGVPFDEARRKQNGLNRKGKPQSEATKERISNKLKGRVVSEETRQKISVGNSGKKRTDSQRHAQSQRMKGKIMSAEARAKSSASHKGKKHLISPEGMANINAHRFKIKVRIIDKEGNYKDFLSLSDAAKELKITVASVSYTIKTGKYNKLGYKITKI